MELCQYLRDLRILHIDPDNARRIAAAITAVIDQIEMKITKQTTARSVCCAANDTHVVHVLSFPEMLNSYSCLVSLHIET